MRHGGRCKQGDRTQVPSAESEPRQSVAGVLTVEVDVLSEPVKEDCDHFSLACCCGMLILEGVSVSGFPSCTLC